MEWISTTDRLPKKPGKRSYEHVWCILRMRDGDTVLLPWNCEHLCWDDEHGDDFKYHPTEPAFWMPLGALPETP